MKIFFDARYTRTDYHDGISRYSSELGNAVARLIGPSDELTFLISDDDQRRWFDPSAQFLRIHPGTSVKEPFTALILNRYKPDVVYSPMQTIGTWGKQYVAVLTLHDMIYYLHPAAPRSLPLLVRLIWWLYHQAYWPQRLLLKGADLLTSVSQTSAREITHARMSKKEIVVVSNAPQSFHTYRVTHKKFIEHIVYMGSFMSYKNVEVLIEGMRWLPGRTLHLLSRITPQRQGQLDVLIPEGATVLFHNGVTDDDYERLLANDAVLASASLDEGYGIPVAEAMVMGVPAVISDIEVFREVGGNGAVYFDPLNPRDFARAVTLLDDRRLRKRHIALGKEHMKQFDWDVSARTLLTAIRREVAARSQRLK